MQHDWTWFSTVVLANFMMLQLPTQLVLDGPACSFVRQSQPMLPLASGSQLSLENPGRGHVSVTTSAMFHCVFASTAAWC